MKKWYYSKGHGVEGVFLVIKIVENQQTFFKKGFFRQGFFPNPHEYKVIQGMHSFFLANLKPASRKLVKEWRLKVLMYQLES